MKYMGSKARISKYILPIILKDRNPGQWYVEPFVGGCNMIDKVDGNRIGNDSNYYIISMWSALCNGYTPPKKITEDEFNSIKANKDKYPPELVGFTGIAMTFGSKWFNTYARNERGVNYAMEGRNNLLKQVENLKGVIFTSSDYANMEIPYNSIIYCDPPYRGVSGYKDKFNHVTFYDWCRMMKQKGHSIYIYQSMECQMTSYVYGKRNCLQTCVQRI